MGGVGRAWRAGWLCAAFVAASGFGLFCHGLTTGGVDGAWPSAMRNLIQFLLVPWWLPWQLAHFLTTVLPALIAWKHWSEGCCSAQKAHILALALHWSFWCPKRWHLVHRLGAEVMSEDLKCLWRATMESIFSVLCSMAVHDLPSAALRTLHFVMRLSLVKSLGVYCHDKPGICDLMAACLSCLIWLRFILSSAVYFTGALRAFSARSLPGMIICRPLEMVLRAMALGLLWNHGVWVLKALMNSLAFCPLTYLAGGTKNALCLCWVLVLAVFVDLFTWLFWGVALSAVLPVLLPEVSKSLPEVSGAFALPFSVSTSDMSYVLANCCSDVIWLKLMLSLQEGPLPEAWLPALAESI